MSERKKTIELGYSSPSIEYVNGESATTPLPKNFINKFLTMSEEEKKATEIIEKFDVNIFQNYSKGLHSDEAKQCALIHVEGIIEELPKLHQLKGKDFVEIPTPKHEYWETVKEIITNK